MSPHMNSMILKERKEEKNPFATNGNTITPTPLSGN